MKFSIRSMLLVMAFVAALFTLASKSPDLIAQVCVFSLGFTAIVGLVNLDRFGHISEAVVRTMLVLLLVFYSAILACVSFAG